MHLYSPGGASPRREPDAAARRLLRVAQDLRDLGARDAHVAGAARGRLAVLAPTPAELLRLVDDPDPFVRSGAARQLRYAPPAALAEVVDALRAAIDDPNGHVVEAAVGSLGWLRAEAARADVRDRLGDASPRVAHAAVYALGRIGPAEEGRHLVRFLEAPPHHLQVAALKAIAHLRYAAGAAAVVALLRRCEGAPRVQRRDFELPRQCVATLAALRSPEGVAALARVAANEVGLRGTAVEALIELKAEAAAPALLPLLARLSESPREERLCARLLGLMVAVDYAFARPEVRRHLGHRAAGVRVAALEGVGRWRDAEALDAVRALCRHDPSPFVRPAAVACLARLLGAEALPELAALADDANVMVRRAVAQALGGMAPLPEQGQALLARLAADEGVAAAACHHAQAAPGAEAPMLPAELRPQAAAARAFLRHWQAGLGRLSAGEGNVELAELQQALKTLLGVLAAGQAAA